MEKQRWFACLIFIQAVLLLLGIAPQTQAKMRSKGKVVVLHAGRVPGAHVSQPKHSSVTAQQRSRVSAQRKERRSLHKPEARVVRATFARARGERLHRARPAHALGSRFTRLHNTHHAAAVAAWRQERRDRSSFVRQSSVRDDTDSPTRQVLIENNADLAHGKMVYSPELAPFLLRVNGEALLYRLSSVFVLPGETVTLVVGRAEPNPGYLLRTEFGTTHVGPNRWTWKAPRETGVYPVYILQPNGSVAAQLNVFVMAPFARLEAGYVNGYRVGRYPMTPFKRLSTYELPRGFIEVTEANQDARVSPHFRLRQFLCKQESDFPKYIVLDPRLIEVLETVLKKVNERGYACPTLSVMSGYRTPFYNRAIGNVTTYSRHLWGDAADVFIDAHPLDGEMDDLNRDGMINIRDTELLFNIVHSLYEPRLPRFFASGLFYEPRLQQAALTGAVEDQQIQRLMTGGLARYRETESHGPFVHVDVRGVFTRWGQ